MFPLAHVMDFLTHELASLRCRRFAGALVRTRALQCLFLRHVDPPVTEDAT
jgi:hypothetical protein